MLKGVAAPHVGFTSPIGLPLTFVHDWIRTCPFDWKVSHQASTAALSCTIPPAPAALRMSTSEARKLLKLIGDLMTVRMVVWSYFDAPFIMTGAPSTLFSA